RCARRPASAGTPMRSTSGPARRTPSPRRSPPATWSAAWPPRRARRSRAPRAVCAEPVQVPDDVRRLLDDLDAFIERELVPLQDRAIQVHGGIGYSRAKPFEHIYRHHRRYRITEGSEEIQIRTIARSLFGFGRDR